MSEENNSLREKLKEERLKSDNLKKEVHKLRLTPKEMPGSNWFLQLLPHCSPRFKNLDFALDFLVHVQNTALDSIKRKSLFVKVSNWNSERHLLAEVYS